MTSTNRRSGFRLPWSADAEDKIDVPATPETADTTPEASPAEPAASVTDAPETDGTAAAAAEPVAVATAPAPMPQPEAKATVTASAAEPFLQNLVEAMRHVAEEARDRNLSELRTMVEKRVEQVGERSAERAEDLRRRSELDIKGIGDWERSELERVRSEAQRKVEARRKQLEQQLHDHEQSSDAEVAAVRTRLADHERELEAFFAQLTEINDPTAFVAAAKRMPAPPSLDALTSDAARTIASGDKESLTSRLAMLGIDKQQQAAGPAANGTSNPEEPSPSLEERLAQLDEQLKPSAEASVEGSAEKSVAPVTQEAGEVSTPIVVKGLGSFGAITSFKQSLERADGIHSVTLSLGPTGEFVYRAAHDAGFDLEGAISALESGGAEIERQSDGTLRVAVNRSR